VQILHERDSCCFSPQGRHDQMLRYEADIRAELQAGGRGGGAGGAGGAGTGTGHGWFTTTADDHTKHEVCAQDKRLIQQGIQGSFPPGDSRWQSLECDIMHQEVPGGKCAANVEPGSAP
jgi:hypothetical protein